MTIKKTVLLLLVIVFSSGCVTNSKKKSDEFSLQGCAVGGFGAGMIAMIAYAGEENSKEKVAIASMLGCMAGAVAGYKIGKRADSYASAEQVAEDEIELNKKNIKQLKHYNLRLQKNIDDYEHQIALISGSAMNQSEKAEYLKKTKKILSKQRIKANDSLTTLNMEINTAQAQYSKYQQQGSSSKTQAWKSEIAGLRQEKLILAGHVETLNALDASI